MIPCASSLNHQKSRSAGNAEPRQDAPSRVFTDLSGQILRRRATGSFILSEAYYPCELKLPTHAHKQAHVTFVLEGAFDELNSSGTITCRTGAVRFLPAGELHENRIDAQSRCLNISADRDVLEQFGPPVIPSKPAEADGLATTWLGHRLYAEFARQDAASAIAMEGLILEILAEIARAGTKPHSEAVPQWLRRATEIVESRFLERLSLVEIASQVGVHYVHLSRQFHKYNRCTVGELIRTRRVQYACHLLAHSRTPLAEIALTCGFSDQSHLSFLFKRYMGLSPSKYRSLAGVNLAAEDPGQASNSPASI